jgi:hypothetical protein
LGLWKHSLTFLFPCIPTYQLGLSINEYLIICYLSFNNQWLSPIWQYCWRSGDLDPRRLQHQKHYFMWTPSLIFFDTSVHRFNLRVNSLFQVDSQMQAFLHHMRYTPPDALPDASPDELYLKTPGNWLS